MKKIIISIVIVVTITTIIFLASTNRKEVVVVEEVEEKIKEKDVSDNIIKISELNYKTEKIEIYGKIESKSQVDVFAEIPAKITRVNVGLGNYVRAGQIVVVLDYQNEQNRLTQAKLNLQSSKLKLNKTLAGPRDAEIKNAQKSVEINIANIEKTEKDIHKNISELKVSLEAVLRKDIDDFFDHTYKTKGIYQPTFIYRLKSKSNIKILEEKRVELEQNFDIFLEKNSETISENIDNILEISQQFSDLSEILYINSKDFIGFSDTENEVFETRTFAIKEKVDGYKKILEGLENSLKNQLSALDISKNNLNLRKSGARSEDVAVSESDIDIAQNSVDSANIALSKKILRAPISGQITSINADIGKLSSNSTPIFSIHNSRNLKIESKISQKNADSIFIGKKVLVKGFPAKVSSISTILNLQGAIDFEAEFLKRNNLISGENVKIEIERKINEKNKIIAVPISSVFEKDNEYFVYILDKDSKTKQTKVIFEKIDGEKIIIKNTFSGEEIIIENSRGIVNNQKI